MAYNRLIADMTDSMLQIWRRLLAVQIPKVAAQDTVVCVSSQHPHHCAPCCSQMDLPKTSCRAIRIPDCCHVQWCRLIQACWEETCALGGQWTTRRRSPLPGSVQSVDEFRKASSCCRRAASSLSSLLCSVFSLICIPKRTVHGWSAAWRLVWQLVAGHNCSTVSHLLARDRAVEVLQT